MVMKVIQLACRKLIDIESRAHWERSVFEDSYNEFLMQFQLFNPEKKYTTFSGLANEVSNVEKLHFRVSAAIAGHIAQFTMVPSVQNTLGSTFLPFHLYRFEIVESSISNRKEHKIAVTFYSEPVILHETIGEHLLISLDPEERTANGKTIKTELVRLQPSLSISSIQYI